MIKAVMAINSSGKVRLSQFYEKALLSLTQQQKLLHHLFLTISARGDHLCYFVDGYDMWPTPDTRIVYRRYATLSIVFVTDSSESCLAILDLIQVFVEVLDRLFKGVCELDFLFHSEKVRRALMEMVMGGMVVEMSKEMIVRHVTEMNRLDALTTSGSGGGDPYHCSSSSSNSGMAAGIGSMLESAFRYPGGGTSSSSATRDGEGSSGLPPFTSALNMLWGGGK
eukprot:gene8053-5606_t